MAYNKKYRNKYYKENAEKLCKEAKDRYEANEEYRKNKRLHTAYKRYMSGCNICKRLVDELKENGYPELEYRRNY